MDIPFIPNQEYKILVECLTFNHAKYIEDALNGFVSQKTNFPFVCLVIDDASTDGEQDVIESFVNKECDIDSFRYFDTDSTKILIAPHRTNQQCQIVVYFLKVNHYSQKLSKNPYIEPWRNHCKFEAFCEGDDYWIDPYKLQKEADILDNNSEISLVYTSFELVNGHGEIIHNTFYEDNIKKSFSGDNLYLLLLGNYIQTLTVCFRPIIWSSEIYVHSPYKYDYTLFLSAAFMGNFEFINSKTGCYRMTATGAMGTEKKKFFDYKIGVLYYFSKKLFSFRNSRFGLLKKFYGRYKVSRIFLHHRHFMKSIKMFLPF